MAQSTLSDLLHRIINRVHDGHKIRGLKTVGIDEIPYCKGRKFATIVYDLTAPASSESAWVKVVRSLTGSSMNL